MKRILALLLSLAVLCTVLFTAMPQTQAATDGMVRVWLKSMDYNGSISSVAFTLNGSYSVPANPDVVLSTRGQYTVEVVGGTLMLSGTGINGVVDMGSKFTIKQHLSDDGSIGTISLYNAKYGNRSYRGDMSFDISGGYLRLINRVYIEDYLYGVLAGELSNTFPIETLKAQAIIARSYVYNRMTGNEPNYEINDTSGDQVYKGYNSANTNIIKAVDDTAGVLLKYNSSTVNAYFGASNGGQVELPGNAWSSSSSLGCYVMKDDPYDVRNPSSRSVTYTFTSNPASLDTAFYTLIQDKVYQKLGYYPSITAIQSVSLSNPVQTDKRSVGISRNYQTMNMTVLVQDSYSGYWGDSSVYDPTFSGTESGGTGATQSVDISISLHGELKYTLFSVDSDLRLFSLENSGDYYYLTLARYGHGVGMSQRGAQQMANEGKSYKDIINFYFDGVSLPKTDFARETVTKYVPMSSAPIVTGSVNASSL
ncbi:MAG: SpoIID/LytB domain-containing protein, partial [Candidatus Spyradocola sp.]